MSKLFVAVLCLIISCSNASAQAPDMSVLMLKAPETYRAIFKTTKGEIIIEANRSWGPMGVDRLYQLIASGFFSNAIFFRVEKNYVIQFGVSGSYADNRFWDPKKLRDEPIKQRNTKGTISFARAGANNRATQLFINMTDNSKLDTAMRNGVKGFVPIAKVIKGMEILMQLNDRYGKKPAAIQDSLYKYGNVYFDKQFPGLDKILYASIIK